MRTSAMTWCVLLIGCNAELIDTRGDDDIGSSSAASTIVNVNCDGETQRGGEINLALVNPQTRIRLSPGVCLVNQRLNVTSDNTTIEGAGPDVTTIWASVPTSQGALFSFDNGGVIDEHDPLDPNDDEIVPLQNPTLRGLGIQTAPGWGQGAITAVYVHDARNFTMEHVSIGPWDATNSTVGIEVRGRDFGLIRKVQVQADFPIRIDTNINDTQSQEDFGLFRDFNKDLDQHHFEDLSLTSNIATTPVIKVTPGVVLRNVTFDGYQSWTHGGFSWLDGATLARRHSNHLRFANVRASDLCSASCGSQYVIEIVKNTQVAMMTDPVPELGDLLVEFSLTAAAETGQTAPAWKGIRTAHSGGTAAGVKRTVLRQVVYEGSQETHNVIDGQLVQIP